eukprot:scaffold13160_cov106-Isochrysis_galbana.AAC.8
MGKGSGSDRTARVRQWSVESPLRRKKNSASTWRVTMAPRQLRLEPIEVDMGADKGVKRVHAESTEESSTQVQFSARATAWGTAWPCPAHCWPGLITVQSFGSWKGK